MGHDLTIYEARVPAPGALVALPEDNPYMPDPPEGMRWYQVFHWRNAYALAEALFPNAGSPDWRVLEGRDVARALDLPKESFPVGTKHRSDGMLTRVWAGIGAGGTFLVEVLR